MKWKFEEDLHYGHFMGNNGSCIIYCKRRTFRRHLESGDSNSQSNLLDDKTQFKVYATSSKSVEGELQFVSSDNEFHNDGQTQNGELSWTVMSS